MQLLQADMSALPEDEMTARREAAAKTARNRQLIIDRLCSHSGVVRRQGSEFGETVENVNGVHAMFLCRQTCMHACMHAWNCSRVGASCKP